VKRELTLEEKRERNRRKHRQWRESNPEGYRLYRKINRKKQKLKRRGIGGSFSGEDIKRIFKAQKGRCAYFKTCGRRLEESYHVDHIMPICLGGSNEASNIQLTCPICNWAKSGDHPVDFAQRLGLLI